MTTSRLQATSMHASPVAAPMHDTDYDGVHTHKRRMPWAAAWQPCMLSALSFQAG